MRAVDFFCGAGGLTRGLLDAGIKVVVGIDSDEQCRRTYESNNEGVQFLRKDIREVTLPELKRLAGVESFDEVLFAGCAPCSPFSQKRTAPEPSNDLTLLMEFGKIVARAKPGYVLIENVPQMANVPGYSTFRRFVRLLEKHGYQNRIAVDVLDAKRFGVPQTRRRLVLLPPEKELHLCRSQSTELRIDHSKQFGKQSLGSRYYVLVISTRELRITSLRRSLR